MAQTRFPLLAPYRRGENSRPPSLDVPAPGGPHVPRVPLSRQGVALWDLAGREESRAGGGGAPELTLTVSSQRAFSLASPDTSKPARSSFISMSSDFLRSSSFWASFSSYCFFSISSFSATWEGPERMAQTPLLGPRCPGVPVAHLPFPGLGASVARCAV